MVNQRDVSSTFGIWALSCIPIATASAWNACTTDTAGVTICRSNLSSSAKINIAIASVIVVLLLLCLIICVISNRRARAASDQEYNVEASQVVGPPTIIATEYNPTSGPSGIYESPKSGSAGQTTAQMTGPAYPVAAQVYNNQTRTAPVAQSTFAYPFPGYSPSMGPVPQTSFVNGGFPRALLAGDRLKDRLKERPASPSHRTFG